ncbi:MAG: sulfate/molybdate ABC transporter ATP-binding protein [Solirubrobacteraceae bacterium]
MEIEGGGSGLMAIEAHDVSKRFGEFEALRDVSVTVDDGSLTALLGPSGSGKSTLLRIIAGLETPDSGRVTIGGQDLTDTPARERGVGFVFQHYAPFKHMTVYDNVAFGLTVRRRPKAQVRERVHELLALVRLDGLAERYPAQLSGGQLQRMALARALAPQPEVLLLDEPFGALDAQVRGELREWLRRLHQEIHVTTIFVTHDQEEAMDVAEQIVVMNRGSIEQAGTPQELYENPHNGFVMSFVGPVNRLGDALLRPHDIQILPNPDDAGAMEALVRRVVRLGFEVRVELTLPDGRDIWAQVTRESAQELELEEGQILPVRLPAPRTFAA